MKQILFCVLCMICTLELSSQTSFQVIGFEGKDTIKLTTATLNKNSQISFDLGDYKGAVQLIPQSKEYQDIVHHLKQIKLINSEATFNAAKAYINDTLPFDALYNSDMWKEYIQYWVGFYAQKAKSPEEFATLFVPVGKQVLDRTALKYPQIAMALSNSLIEFFEQYGLDNAAENMAAHTLGINLPYGEQSEIAHRLLLAQKLIGKPAPKLSGASNQAQAADNSPTTLLLFYESGCDNCVKQIDEIKKYYSKLQSKNIRVVSISADKDMNVFNYHSKEFPWEEKYCDLKGFDGEDFKNYGVASTPTIYIIDEKGIITGRYFMFEQTKLIAP